MSAQLGQSSGEANPKVAVLLLHQSAGFDLKSRTDPNILLDIQKPRGGI